MPTRRRPTFHQRRLRELHAAAKTDAEIARALRLSASYTWRLREKLGLPRVPAPPHPTRSFDERKAMALYKRGLVDREIARKLGISRETVQKWRSLRSLPANGWGGSRDG